MHSLSFVVLFFAVILVQIPARLASAGTLELSLSDALSRADLRAFRVKDAANSVKEIEARKVGLGTLFRSNPRVQADLRPPVTGGTLADLGFAANVELLFDFGGAPSARVAEVGAEAEIARRRVAVARLDARFEVHRAYVQARIAESRLFEAEQLRQTTERVLDAARQRETAGSSGDIDVSLARTEVAEALARLEAAKRERATATMRIREALDLPASTELKLTSSVDDPAPLGDRDRLVRQAIASRPELAAIFDRLRYLDRTEERISRENFPKLGIYAGVDAAPVSPIFGFVGLSGELPIFLRNRAGRAVVERTRESEKTRLEYETRQIEREVTLTLDSFNARLTELRILTTEGVPSARRTLELVDAGWRAGRFDIFRVTSASRDLARLVVMQLDALEAVWTDRIAIARSVGTELP